VALLELRDVSEHFGGLAALDGVSFEVHEGEILGLIGPNGAGKTTAFNVISGFLPVTRGKISFDGKNITNFKPHTLVKMGLTRTWQANVLIKDKSCFDNVLFAQHIHWDMNPIRILFPMAKARDSEKRLNRMCVELLELVGLGEHNSDQMAGQLPHGHQRALSLCMALATRPRLLLLDEPVTGLNPEEATHMVNLVKTIHQQMGITVVIVEHNMRTIMGISHRIVVLDYGKVIAEGLPEEITANEKVIEAYLGSGFRSE
jgi:branched-chain amino acid transport system ATP-binding protein